MLKSCNGSGKCGIALLALFWMFFCTLWIAPAQMSAQVSTQHFLSPSDTLNKSRFWVSAGTSALLYTGAVISLNEIWYKQYERTGFHFYNDWGEWENMDKMGHLYTAYFESMWAYKLARWTGIEDRKAQMVGAVGGIVLQSTIEIMDGFSEKWGFSAPDFGFNVLGSATFFVQQRIWNEQRIIFKVSSTPQSYPDLNISSQDGEHFSSLHRRTDDLFGRGFFERFIKDYNAQTVWASVNVHAFLHSRDKTTFPKWLNFAIGYGAENMFGGFDNTWVEDGIAFSVDPQTRQRYKQWYLGLDVDLTRIPSNKPMVRTLLGLLNVFKIPSPTLELSSKGITGHFLHF